MRTLIIGILIGLFCPAVHALHAAGLDSASNLQDALPLIGQSQDYMQERVHYLAEAGSGKLTPSQPESGSLVLPEDETDKKEKKCLTVCKQWGEDCIINPRTGSRDCRRTCKAFGEECF